MATQWAVGYHFQTSRGVAGLRGDAERSKVRS
jgi:hypothetical protein